MTRQKSESLWKSELIKKIETMFPGAYVLKNDPSSYQGIPDITILWKDKWATLETKRSSIAKKQPNQEHYVNDMNKLSFSAFIYPENEREVLDELKRSFGT